MMSSESGNRFPIGEPTFWAGNYIPKEAAEESRYFFIRFRTKFYIKKNKLPFIQIKGSWLYRGTEMLTTSDVYNSKDGKYYIVSGKGYIKFEDTNEYFGKKDTIRIEPGKVHSIVATENTILHEVSTPHLDDTIRVKDYYSSKTPSGDR